MTKVVVVNGSIRMENNDATMIVEPFLNGMKKAGASVELFYVARDPMLTS